MLEFVSPDDLVEDAAGRTVAVRDLPVEERFVLGVGHGHFGPHVRWRITTGRLPGPWPYPPDLCPYASAGQGWWTRDGHDLFCPGCGLNGT